MQDDTDLRQQVKVLQDRQDIYDCLTRYCRGVDRLDRELIVSAYHHDAIDDHGFFVGGPEDFADYFIAFHGENQHGTQHIVTNHSLDLEGDVAHCETYWVYAAMNKQGAELSLAGGRYIDRFERREGRWAIAGRKCLMDWSGTPGDTGLAPEALAMLAAVGVSSRDKSDTSYERPFSIDQRRIDEPPQSSPGS